MAQKPNHGYEKRQKELARLAKQEEKRKRKQDKNNQTSTENGDEHSAS